VDAGQDFSATVIVKNESTKDGDEVVQLYLSFPPVAGAPLHALRGFQRVHLKAGESRQVGFTLHPRDLGMVTEAGVPIVSAGQYWLLIGGGQQGGGVPTVSGNFSIKSSLTLPE
jgi:beta-glucosidase